MELPFVPLIEDPVGSCIGVGEANSASKSLTSDMFMKSSAVFNGEETICEMSMLAAHPTTLVLVVRCAWHAPKCTMTLALGSGYWGGINPLCPLAVLLFSALHTRTCTLADTLSCCANKKDRIST